MKKLFFIILTLLTVSGISAQEHKKRGIALGADRDTLQYIIASPFDNWYLNIRGGVQTFIGNEVHQEARKNKLDYNFALDIGKWVIPDLAVSLRISYFSVHGQSRYAKHPFIDFTGVPTSVDPYDGIEYPEYQPFTAQAVAALGFVTLDWTNLLLGYQAGKRRKLHLFTPVGLGASMLFGNQVNPNPSTGYNVGDFRHNFELAYSVILGAEYTFSPKFAMSVNAELFGSESTWDWSPYDNSYSIFDLVPTVTLGMKFNLLSYVTKYNPHTHMSYVDKVNHEFVSYGTKYTVSNLNNRIQLLNSEKDSLENMAYLAGQRAVEDSIRLTTINRELMELSKMLGAANATIDSLRSPANVLEELIQVNEVLNLPATIVFYQLDKYDLDYNARKRLQEFAKEMHRIDDTIQFYLIGAADSVTGTIRHNQWLSEKRCQAAYNMLVNEFRVSGNQLIMVPIGGITDYEPKENNRMAMIILRTPVTEEIVERWLRKRTDRLR